MRKSLSTLLTLLLAISALFAGEAKEKAKFQTYKEMMKKDPSLIRFYTFEEGKGDEISNHVILNPAQTAYTGGTLGSLSIQRYVKGGHSGISFDPKLIPPSWTQGRWPWKSAVSSGIETSSYPWEATKLFRSGITGVELEKGGTHSGWFRIHENNVSEEGCNLITLGGGWGSGFILYYSKAKWSPNGRLCFR